MIAISTLYTVYIRVGMCERRRDPRMDTVCWYNGLNIYLIDTLSRSERPTPEVITQIRE